MIFNKYFFKVILSSLVIMAVLFTYGCPANDTSDNSNIEVQITEKKFSRSTCSDGVAEALSIEFKAILLNNSKTSGTIDDWQIDFYQDGSLLIMINKSNYEDYACADQAVDMSEEIITSGYFNFYGFVQYSLFNNIIPNKTTVTLTIKDKSGYTYKINHTF